MIISIKHKGLKLFWETGSQRYLPQDQVLKIRLILDILNDAKQVPQDLIAFKNLGIHKLKGNWRIIFRFEEENIYDVNFVDYH
jgi:proteic killer suppression protein